MQVCAELIHQSNQGCRSWGWELKIDIWGGANWSWKLFLEVEYNFYSSQWRSKFNRVIRSVGKRRNNFDTFSEGGWKLKTILVGKAYRRINEMTMLYISNIDFWYAFTLLCVQPTYIEAGNMKINYRKYLITNNARYEIFMHA